MTAKIITLSNKAQIYQLKISLDHVKPPIWRRIQVKSNISLYTLHNIIQIAMGWTNSHMHDYRKGNIYYGMIEDEYEPMEEMLDEKKYKINHVIQKIGDSIEYVYDFGDGWRHVLALEKILHVEKGQQYPACLTGKRNCPPEDCGGSYGYLELIEAISNPGHEDHEEMKAWVGNNFDPEYFDKDEINEELAEISNNPNYEPGIGFE